MTWTTIIMPSLAFAQTSTNSGGDGAITQSNSSSNNTHAEGGPIAAGRINLKQAAVDFINGNLNATLFDAAEAAERQVQNSTVIAGRLDAVEGYLAYNITVADTDNNVTYRVYVDPSDGKIVSTSVGRPVSALGIPPSFEDLNATMIDAADVAENQIENSTAIAGSFAVTQGNALVYSVMVADLDKGLIYKVDIDAATGNAASISKGMPIGDLGIEGVFGHQ
ncbi:PepSY domain-containing protein [Candidatus Nitrososphaera evergladensis]|nr:PepSY domain-containing protein [Candidatus Nitrososphaera evergladensis]